MKKKYLFFGLGLLLSTSGGGGVMSVTVDKGRYYPNPFLEIERSFHPHSPPFPDQLRAAGLTWFEKLKERVGGGRSLLQSEDASVYTGITGIILTLLKVQETTGRIDQGDQELLNRFAKAVVKGDFLRRKRFTFLCGDAGPIVAAYMISKDDHQARQTLLQKLSDLQDIVLLKTGRDGSLTPNEILYGRAGYLYSLLYLNQQFPETKPVPEEVISRSRAYMKPEYISKVKETLDWLVSQQLFPSGNLRSSKGSNEDKLVQWCHGAPGAVFLFLEAAKVFKSEKEKYIRAALGSGDVIWQRGILRKGYSICHGSAGNSYALLALYKHTNDSLWLRRACLFAQWCFSWGKLASREPDRPNSLFEGLAGTVYLLHDLDYFLRNRSGSTASFPGFELD